MPTISLKLPDSLLQQLEGEARARRVTKSHVVRMSLEKALNQRQGSGSASCYDLARDLAGTVKGLPKDLATKSQIHERIWQVSGGRVLLDTGPLVSFSPPA